jgi:hypothetical protein
MKKAILLTLAAATLAMPAMANQKHKGMHDMHGQMFDKIDTDRDGKITKAEHDAFSEKKFSEMDANNDGVLTKDEMAAYKKNYGYDVAPSAGGNPRNNPTATGNVDPQKKALEDKM